MRRSAELPRVLSAREAASWGLSESAIRHAVTCLGWQRLARGVVLTRPDPPTRDDWAHAGLALAGPSGALSGWDAVRIRGIGAPTAPSPQVLIITRSGNQRCADGVLVRRTSRPYWTTLLPAEHPTLPFVPLAHPARTVADTALSYRTRAPVRALVTAAIQRGLCRAEDLVAEYERGPRGGSFWLRRALDDVLVNAHSIAEAEATEILTAARVPSFELNVDVVDAAGRFLGTADILWRALRAVGEIQSRAFHFDETSWTASMARHNLLSRHTLTVAHWPPSEIRRRRAAWAADVAEWLRARATEVDVPYVPGTGAHRPPPGGAPPLIVP